MPKIPTFHSTAIPPGVSGSVYAPLNLTSQKWAVAGRGMAILSDEFRHINREKQRELDKQERELQNLKEMEDLNYISEATTRFSNLVTEFSLKDSQNPEGHTNRMQDFMRDKMSELVAAAKTPKAQGTLERSLNRFFAQQTGTALKIEHAGKINRYSNSLNEKLSFLEKQAFLNPNEVDAFFAEGAGFVAAAAEEGKGWMPPHKAQAILSQWRGKIYETSFRGLLDLDPEQAKAEIEAGHWNQFLDAAQIEKLRNLADQAHKGATAFETARAKQLIQDDLTSRAVTGQGSPQALSIVRVILGDEAAQEFEKEQKFNEEKFNYRELLKSAPASEGIKILDRIKPKPGQENYAEKYRFFVDVSSDYQRMQNALMKDPAQYVSQFPNTESAEQSLSRQEALGVPAHMRRVTTLAQSNDLVNRINSMPPESRADTIEVIANDYGPHWPMVLKEMVNSGLPAETQVLAFLDRPEDAGARVAVANAVKLGKTKLKELIADPTVIKDVTSTVHDQLSDFSESIMRGGFSAARITQLNEIQKAVELTALLYVSQGQDPTDAARSAAHQIINSKYHFNTTYRVPSEFNSDAVEDYAQETLDSLDASSIQPYGSQKNISEDQRRKVTLQGIQRDGWWATNEDENGLVLMHLGIPVRNIYGNRIEIYFKDAAHKGPIFRARIKK